MKTSKVIAYHAQVLDDAFQVPFTFTSELVSGFRVPHATRVGEELGHILVHDAVGNSVADSPVSWLSTD